MEYSPSIEQPKITRQQAIEAYSQFVNAGILNPDNLDIDDPMVKEANDMFYKWQNQLDTEAGDNEIAMANANLSKTMFYVDAGFIDRNYLEEVSGDWLMQDEENAEDLPDSLEKDSLLLKIKEAKSKIDNLLNS